MAANQPQKTISRRSAARIAAVQALYEIDITDAQVGGVLDEFLARRWPAPETEDGAPANMPEPDKGLMADLVKGVRERCADLDGMIEGALTNTWTPDRLEVLLRAILRAGAYELIARADIDAGTVISEYVDMAHAFYDGPEPALVNGVLDRLAGVVRSAGNPGGDNDKETASE